MTGQSSKSLAPTALKRPRGRPPDEDLQERRRAQILDRATIVFAAAGYRNADVQDVADPVGISKGTVYRYFPTKEALFLAAVRRGVARLDAAMNEVMGTVADPVDRLAAGTVAYLRFFEANPALVELFIQERAEFREKRKPVYFEHGCESECHWKQMLEQLIADGRLRNVPSERIMTVVGDLLYGTMFTNHLLGRSKPFAEQATDINDVLFHGILSDRERKTSAARRAGTGPAVADRTARRRAGRK